MIFINLGPNTWYTTEEDVQVMLTKINKQLINKPLSHLS